MTLLQQYRAWKAEHPDVLLLLGYGHFYKAFDGDAELLMSVLALTRQEQWGVTMAEFVYPALYPYVRKLVRMGYKVTVAEPVEGNMKITRIVEDE
jgi:DNA mismatch repair protein MutS